LNRKSQGGASIQHGDDVIRWGSNGHDSTHQRNNIFGRGSDAATSAPQQHDEYLQSRRIETSNDTYSMNIQSNIRACECDGTECTSEEKHVGDSISICLWSNFLDIDKILNLTLFVGDLSYQPVENGTANELTEMVLHGKLAVITTMIISAFFDNANPSDLVVDATVSFAPLVGGNRRHLASISNHSLIERQRSLLVPSLNRSVIIFALTCLLSTIIMLSVAIGAVIAKGYCRGGRSSRSLHGEDEDTEETRTVSK